MGVKDHADRLNKAVATENWKEMKEAAHLIKGSSGYIGASHLQYSCYFI